MKKKKGVSYDVDLTADDLKELASQFKAEYNGPLLINEKKLTSSSCIGVITNILHM